MITVLALQSLPRFGRKTVRTLLLRLRNDASPPHPDDLRGLLAVYSPESDFDRHTIDRAMTTALETVEAAHQLGVALVTVFDDSFPPLLREIPDPPVLLFVKGSLKALRGLPTVAVIGTREPTEYGEVSAQLLGKRFAERGFAVVSGLARGCDAFAHRGCVAVGGIGIAVLAHGLDTVYPAENRSLAESLLECGGCLVSEYQFKMRAHRSHFIDRDRLQSGLSRGVVVVETDVKGGTMHTVGFAQAQHRCLACIVHPQQYAGEPKVQGNQYLLRSGEALPLADATDLEQFASALLGDWTAAGCSERFVSRSDANGQRSFW